MGVVIETHAKHPWGPTRMNVTDMAAREGLARAANAGTVRARGRGPSSFLGKVAIITFSWQKSMRGRSARGPWLQRAPL